MLARVSSAMVVLLSAILAPATSPRAFMTEPEPTLAQQLETATRGMLFMSETDSPLVPFVSAARPGPLAAAARRIAGRNARDPVAEVPFDDFFRPLTASHDWDGPDERAAVRRFKKLETLLSTALDDRHVFKIGEIEIDIVVIGRTTDGGVAGFRTRALET